MEIAKDQRVEFDEFSRTCDLVEEYFDELLDEVAINAPVSRRQLTVVLARAQLSGRQFALEGLADCNDLVYQSNVETLLWLDGGFWIEIGEIHDLTPDDVRAAREVHRRMIEAVDGDVSHYNRERDPFVLIERRYERD